MKDYLGNKYFAGILAKQIQDYWVQRGHLVKAWAEPIPTHPGLFQVRSNIRFSAEKVNEEVR